MNSSFSFVCIVLLLFYIDWVTLALPWVVLFEEDIYLLPIASTIMILMMILWFFMIKRRMNDMQVLDWTKNAQIWLTPIYWWFIELLPFEGLIKFRPWSSLPLGWHLRSPEKDHRIRHPSSWHQRRLNLIVGYIEPSPQSQIGEKQKLTCSQYFFSLQELKRNLEIKKWSSSTFNIPYILSIKQRNYSC